MTIAAKAPDAKDRMRVLAIFCLSVTIRLLYLFQIRSTPVYGFYAVDSKEYHEAALRILSGKFFDGTSLFLSSLYPALLAALYRVFRVDLDVIGVTQALIDSMTGLVLYLICSDILKRKTMGLVALITYAFYAAAIFYTGFIMETTFSAFFLVLFIYFALKAVQKNKNSLLFVSGIMASLTILLRANALLLTPFIVTWITFSLKKQTGNVLNGILLFCLGLGMVWAPFSVRNYFMTGSLSPLPQSGGINFYIGNNPQATGIYKPPDQTVGSAVVQTRQSVALASKQAGRSLSPAQASGYWYSKGTEYILHHPYDALSLTIKKLYYFWNGTEIPGSENFEFCAKYSPILMLPLFSFGVVAPFALVGMFLAWRRKEDTLSLVNVTIAVYLLSVILFFVNARYRFPVVPLIILMASYGLSELAILLKRGKTGKRIFGLGVLILLFFLTNRSIAADDRAANLCINYNNLGVSYYNKGNIQEAIRMYEKALLTNPHYADAYANLAGAYYRMGDKEKAYQYYDKALTIKPHLMEALYGMANLYADDARYAQAVQYYEMTIKADPYFIDAYDNLAFTYLKLGQEGPAEIVFKKLILIAPEYAEAHNNLGALYARTGRKAEAIGEFKKALKIKPEYPRAKNNLEKLLKD